MSHIIHDDLDWEYFSDSGPGWASMGQRRRDPIEAARLKAERARKQEDEILAQAEAIRARREELSMSMLVRKPE